MRHSLGSAFLMNFESRELRKVHHREKFVLAKFVIIEKFFLRAKEKKACYENSL